MNEQAVIDAVPKKLYIAGEWRDGGEGGTLEVEDPATGDALCEIADATPEDARAPRTRSRPSGATTRRASAARSCAARGS